MDLSGAVAALIGAGVALAVRAGEGAIERWYSKSARSDALRDADLQILGQVVFEVRDLAVSYWAELLDPVAEAKLNASIVGRLTFASELAEELFIARADLLRDILLAVNRFDTACTSGSFGVKARSIEPNRCRDIEVAAFALVRKASSFRRKL